MVSPRDIVVSVEPVTVKVTGAGFFVYAKRYAAAARLVESAESEGFDPVVYQLYCQALELFLKSFIWLKEGKTPMQIKNKYGHDLVKLWCHCKSRGIFRYATPTPLRDEVIALLGPYYKDRQFAYFDLDMIVTGYSEIESEVRALPALRRLVAQLGKALRSPVLSAS